MIGWGGSQLDAEEDSSVLSRKRRELCSIWYNLPVDSFGHQLFFRWKVDYWEVWVSGLVG